MSAAIPTHAAPEPSGHGRAPSHRRQQPRARRQEQPRRQEQQGAAMLVTMLVLLATTATGIFAFYSTGYELRTAGYARAAAQAHYVSEGSVPAAIGEFDRLRGAVIVAAQQSAFPQPIAPEPSLSDLTPAQQARTWGYRFYMSDFAVPATRIPVFDITDDADGASLGPGGGSTRQPTFIVDLNDMMITQQPIPGASASGIGVASTYVNVTYTGRGQVGPTASFSGDGRSLEATRSHTVAGPFPGLR